jgi:predicted LPLAT superfamily acyltransferase
MTKITVYAVVPTHNHWQVVAALCEQLRVLGVTVLIVDDGSDSPAREALSLLHAPERDIVVLRLARNEGKGAAVLHGMRLASSMGASHCLQIDADGQHDMAAVAPMLALAAQHPDALVTGYAIYDSSAPLGRVVGRWITHVCVWLETLSFDIRDSMCGLRVYPLAAVEKLRKEGQRLGRGMDFDTEIAVRLHRASTPVINHAVQVSYPAGNLSNFRLWRDNVRITQMHTRLFLDLLRRRSPRDSQRDPAHWGNLAERGLLGGLRLTAFVYRRLGPRLSMGIVAPVVLYFYATDSERRRASLAFLRRALSMSGERRNVGWWDGYRHFLAFAGRALDTLAGWLGCLPRDAVVARDTTALEEAMAQRRGALFLVSHHGNVDVSRALLDRDTRDRLVILVHTKHAEKYNQVLRELNPEAAMHTVQVTEVGPDTAIELQQRIERGDWLFIAGDRTPVGGGGRTSVVPFLGAPAEFPQGPYILASLLGCPVYLFFCARRGKRYELVVEHFAERIVLPRGRRQEAIAAHAARYAARLEARVMEDPYQWYNFFDFWRRSASAGPS